jgi:asparagine synthase (glutamine-hydrolysing)
MCGIAGMFGYGWKRVQLEAMVASQRHRGPDMSGIYVDSSLIAGLGHRRLSILDLSDAGRQPMSSADGRYHIMLNGEIYNYLELREELGGQTSFFTRTDTEVLLAAYIHWGEQCLDRLIGMFAFAIWDEREQKLFAARDRFGVKPLFLYEPAAGGLWLASEIKALHAAGVSRELDERTWATYLSSGMYDHEEWTFWKGIRQLPPGACLTWTPERKKSVRIWYDPAEAALKQGIDTRDAKTVANELLALLEHSVRLRFRSDVPVGICLSGGLDSSLLLGLIHRLQGPSSEIKTFTFVCGDPLYDETPWVRQILAKTRHSACFCQLNPMDVQEITAKVQFYQDEPFGGLPTLGMVKVHECARTEGVTVLLDGNGMDEAWCGYEYYARANAIDAAIGPVQGSRSASTRPDCLTPEFASLVRPFAAAKPFGDPLRDLQYRDLRHAKIPRAMRFADRVSMMFSRELREPFLDHRIVELGLRQPAERKIRDGQDRWLLRRLSAPFVPEGVRQATKRPLQTPQREWLRGPLREWADERVAEALAAYGGTWLDVDTVQTAWQDYCNNESDNSFYIWQWISLGMLK